MRPDIEAVSETFYLPLYALALESRADRPIVLDQEAVRLTENLNETLASSEKRAGDGGVGRGASPFEVCA